MTPERLQEWGEAIYGPGKWKQPLAKEAGINRRTMTRWFERAGKGEEVVIPLTEQELRAIAKRVHARRGETIKEVG